MRNRKENSVQLIGNARAHRAIKVTRFFFAIMMASGGSIAAVRCCHPIVFIYM